MGGLFSFGMAFFMALLSSSLVCLVYMLLLLDSDRQVLTNVHRILQKFYSSNSTIILKLSNFPANFHLKRVLNVVCIRYIKHS